jgi:putative acetyltransferase
MIRHEQRFDADAVHRVNELAFGRQDVPDLVDRLRLREEPLLSLVAVEGGQVVGHILFSPVTVHAEDGSFGAVGLGPLAVLPAYQKQGIGSRLVEAGLAACREAGHKIVFVLGHPDYYPRFGFQVSKPLGIEWEGDAPAEAFMVLELREGALAGRGGTVRFLPEFNGV